MKTINTSKECLKCKYCTLDDSDKRKIVIQCSEKNKQYTYGQRIPCDDYEKAVKKQ